ncbi:MAG: T9SS type A sorting domain-containing protein [Ignavibacteriaceae bacterium]|nr:T9SS type A sorting domain-containing protein [Ignavibacterium sp.]MCC6253729.1 T9SS type A sorting domain-containing protein [Ignavibacteriaceae bacterium]
MNAAWVAANCEIVSFIQNLNGKEILQGNKVALNELGPLPVELTSFSAKATAGKVNLNWTTATEINNSGFEVERSFDGSTFFTVGFVRGNGTTTEPKAYSFSDELDVNGTETIYYRLKQVDYNGAFEYSDVVSVVFDLPTDFALGQNYPNPFNPTSKIKYSVPQSGLVSIVVYDLTGQEVATIINEVKEPGNYEINFNAGGLSSGVYFYRMTADNFTQVKKMSILK